MTLTKAQIAEAMAETIGISKSQGMEASEKLLEIMKLTLENGENVLVSRFGKFCVNQKVRRRGRNPSTGDELMLSARKVVTFKCSGKLKDKINRNS